MWSVLIRVTRTYVNSKITHEANASDDKGHYELMYIFNISKYHPKMNYMITDRYLYISVISYILDKDVHTSYRSRPEGAGPAKIVLIVAYLRSGSTFTASLLTQNPEVFYVFEPLHTIQTNLHKYNRLRYINGTVRCSISKIALRGLKLLKKYDFFYIIVFTLNRSL